MMENVILTGQNVKLTLMTEYEFPDNIKWLNDVNVTKWMQKPYPQTQGTMWDYYNAMQKPNLWLAIYTGGRHIGNISLKDNREYNYHSEISIMIGDEFMRGKGFATEAIRLLTDYCFRVRNVHKLRAGAVVDNVACIRAFRKSGYMQECVEKNAVYANGKYRDIVILTYLKREWDEKNV